MNDKYSFCYDPLATMRVTINNQLLILMLVESLHEDLDIKTIYKNTDGITCIVPNDKEEKFKKMVSKWEDLTGFTMEYQYFDALFLRDVNNFIAKSGDYVKLKGAYEIDKKVGNELVLNKDSSMRIVPIAVKEYFINGIPVEETIKNHNNIYDFCIGKRVRQGWYFTACNTPESNPIKMHTTKVVRYYVSTKGCVLYKNHIDGRKSFLEAYPKGKENKGKYWKLRLFNKYKKKENYEIDYEYYIREANKLINAIE